MTGEMINKTTRELKHGRVYRTYNEFGNFITYVTIRLRDAMGTFPMHIAVSPREVRARRVII